MPERILYPEFRAEVESTKYPFRDDATLTSNGTLHVIDDDTFLDATLYPIGAAERAYVSKIVVTPRAVAITVGDTLVANRASVTFNPLIPPDNLILEDTIGRPAGLLISESLRLARFNAWDSGTHTFNREATEFVASVVIPTPELGVRGFVTEDGELFTGDVWMVGEDGVVLRADGDCVVRVDIVGDPLFLRKLCFPIDLFEPPIFIKTVNGCGPDAQGNFNITVGDQAAPDGQTIIRLNPTDNGLRIEAVGQNVNL